MRTVAVTVIGRDRPGIIAEVTAVVSELGGNLEDSSMTLLRGHFAWMLVAAIEREPSELAAALEGLTDDGLMVSVMPVLDDGNHDVRPASYLLTVHGADRPGIVASVTAIVAKHGGNITDLSTRLGARGLYVLLAEVALPADIDVVALGEQLGQVGQDLGVGVSLRPTESDVL
jgi:glycine cleavage system transcriptional repressor